MHALFAGLRNMLVMLLLGLLPLTAQATTPTPVVVMTSYPNAVVSRFEAAFEKQYPQYRLQILWRMPNDALPWLQKENQGGVDVYWSASPRTFNRLKQEGALRKLPAAALTLPARIGNTDIADADGFFVASEVAGYGFALNSAALKKTGAPIPADWSDLTDARLANQIALPIPARVGFAPVMVDIVLQAYGWERGWALWSEISGNAQLVDRGATFVSDEVASGKCAVGLSIDFFVASAIANGSALDFVYPAHGGINPGQIAITASTANIDGAQAFTNFVLSDAGQTLLTHADIRKLPVRESVYATLPSTYHNPYAAAKRGAYQYDNGAGRSRLALVAALFQQLWVEPHAELASLWQRVHKAEQSGRDMSAVRALLGAVPLSMAQAGDTALQQQFREHVEGADATLTQAERRWRDFGDRQRAQARQLLDRDGL